MKVNKMSNNIFLNLYDVVKDNKHYYIASRRKEEDLSCVTGHHDKCDAVMVVPQYENGDLIILKQYRKAIADYIYEFPAGLVDPGETIEQTAIRELKEETGLDVVDMELLIKPSYSSVGMTDESVAIYKATVSGEISLDYKSDNEDIEVIILKEQDVAKFIKEHNIAMRTALILWQIASRREGVVELLNQEANKLFDEDRTRYNSDMGYRQYVNHMTSSLMDAASMIGE